MEALATVRGYESLPRNSYEAIMNHLANVGPLSVAVAATDWAFYFGGVFDGCSFDENIEINHGTYFLFAVHSYQFKVTKKTKKKSKAITNNECFFKPFNWWVMALILTKVIIG